MVNGAFNPRFASGDLRLEQRNALVKLVDRIGVEVLLAQLGNQIVLATRQIFVGVHGPSVDRGRRHVNNGCGPYGLGKILKGVALHDGA